MKDERKAQKSRISATSVNVPTRILDVLGERVANSNGNNPKRLLISLTFLSLAFFFTSAKGAHHRMERYKVDRLIGEGSYGNAYLCTLKDDAEKMYVLKKIGLGKLSQVERETAWHEVRILKQLKHPFVLSHIDSFTVCVS